MFKYAYTLFSSILIAFTPINSEDRVVEHKTVPKDLNEMNFLSPYEKINEELFFYQNNDFEKINFNNYFSTKELIHQKKILKLNKKIDERDEKIEELKKELENIKKEVKKKNEELEKNRVKNNSNKQQISNNGNVVAENNGHNFIATFYTAFCPTGCTGKTATGVDVSKTIYHKGKRVIAVDPSVIPLGSLVRVTNESMDFEAYAVDTGGAIKGSKIDILVSSRAEASKLGVQKVKVKIIK